jgi:hypothetical protein
MDEEISEVRFTYTMLDASYRVMAGAYVWEVGPADGEVRAPRHVEPRVRSGESESPGSGDSGK